MKTSGTQFNLLRHEAVLLIVVIVEAIYFNAVGRNFGTAANVANIVRQSAEIGLLALVMTPVILTGGIDLSVGSLLGLCAIAFGMLWKDVGFSPPLAALGAVGVGALGGGLNAALITRLRLPPLIVTLGTFSLFRGLAEAFTGGTRAFTNFPESFLALGNGFALGVPAQAWILAAVAIAIWLLVHRTTFGRSFRAIGFAPEGARYAGIPVERRLALAYTLAGAVAGLAAVVFVSRVTEARANAGAGYELAAITAVVLGGTSIFGGTGTVHGTLLGVAAIAVLTNGLSRILSIMAISRELSGMLTGALLLLALAAGALTKTFAERRGKKG
ncbi:MAG TPA: ABC transporter permease [Chthoniobacteraceae bacterium]|nr:ABC transporter permease [Chthoniobacteraceae bacterium]